MKIAQLLKELGVNTLESDVFEALLSFSDGATVVRISRALNVPRPTVYARLDRLIQKGLVKKGLAESGAVYYPEGIDAVQSLFFVKKNALNRQCDDLTNFLKKQRAVSAYAPRFTVVQNENVAENIFRDVLRSREPMVQWFWPAKEMLSTVPKEVFVGWLHDRVKRKMRVHVLYPREQKIFPKESETLGPKDMQTTLREIRILPKSIDTRMGYCIYGNKVAFISSKRERYGFIIDSKELADMHRSQFEYLWKQSKSFYKDK